MKIMPAWITEQTDEGVVCIPGSQPHAGSVEVLIPTEDVDSVVIHDASPIVDGRRFGIIVIKSKKETRT